MDAETVALIARLIAADLNAYEANAGYIYPDAPPRRDDEQFADSWGASGNQECSTTLCGEEFTHTQSWPSDAISDDLWRAIAGEGEIEGTEEEDHDTGTAATEDGDIVRSNTGSSQNANDQQDVKDSSLAAPLEPEEEETSPAQRTKLSPIEEAKESKTDLLAVESSDSSTYNEGIPTEEHDLRLSFTLGRQNEDGDLVDQTSQDSTPLPSPFLLERKDKGKAKAIDPPPISLEEGDRPLPVTPPPNPASTITSDSNIITPQNGITTLDAQQPGDNVHPDIDNLETNPQVHAWKQQYRKITGHDFDSLASHSSFSRQSRYPSFYNSLLHGRDEEEGEEQITITIDDRTGETVIKIPWCDPLTGTTATTTSATTADNGEPDDDANDGDGGAAALVPLTEIIFLGDGEEDDDEEREDGGGECEIVRSVGDVVVERWREAIC